MVLQIKFRFLNILQYIYFLKVATLADRPLDINVINQEEIAHVIFIFSSN